MKDELSNLLKDEPPDELDMLEEEDDLHQVIQTEPNQARRSSKGMFSGAKKNGGRKSHLLERSH